MSQTDEKLPSPRVLTGREKEFGAFAHVPSLMNSYSHHPILFLVQKALG